MAAPIAPRPPIETAGPHVGHVIGRKVAADLVALIDRGPEFATGRIPVNSDRIEAARVDDADGPGGRVAFQDGGAVHLLVHAVNGEGAVGPGDDIETGREAV